MKMKRKGEIYRHHHVFFCNEFEGDLQSKIKLSDSVNHIKSSIHIAYYLLFVIRKHFCISKVSFFICWEAPFFVQCFFSTVNAVRFCSLVSRLLLICVDGFFSSCVRPKTGNLMVSYLLLLHLSFTLSVFFTTITIHVRIRKRRIINILKEKLDVYSSTCVADVNI